MGEKRERRHSEEHHAHEASPHERPRLPPIPTPKAQLDRYRKQASASMANLNAFASSMGDMLSAKQSEPGPPPRQESAPERAQRFGGLMAAASRRPRPVHSRIGTDAEFEEASCGNESPPEVVIEGDYSVLPELAYLDDSHYQSYSSEIIGQWLPGMIGEGIASRMDATPPSLSTFQEAQRASVGQIFMELQMIGSIGGYLVGTNAIVIPEGSLDLGEAEARHVLLHELLHYASWLGGGRSVRWRDDEGRPVFQGDAPAWNSHEGLTELMAQETVREKGYDTPRIGYPAETMTCFYMERLLGEGGHDMLLQAYLHGDFTEVRSRLDSALGAGSFEALLAKPDAAQALSYILARMDERGIDRSEWDSSPIMTLARAKLEEGR